MKPRMQDNVLVSGPNQRCQIPNAAQTRARRVRDRERHPSWNEQFPHGVCPAWWARFSIASDNREFILQGEISNRSPLTVFVCFCLVVFHVIWIISEQLMFPTDSFGDLCPSTDNKLLYVDVKFILVKLHRACFLMSWIFLAISILIVLLVFALFLGGGIWMFTLFSYILASY